MKRITKNKNDTELSIIPLLDKSNNIISFKYIPKSIRDSMVIWYDIAKQKATNLSMTTNPILKDFSENGNNATCYNFAWSGMSGIGGYVQSNFNIRANDSSTCAVSVNDNVVTYQNTVGDVIRANNLILYDTGTNWNRDVETKVKAGKYGLNVYATEPKGVNPKNILSLSPYETGSFTYAQSDYDDGKTVIMFGNTIEVPVGEANSFEFLPLYPNALVSDGVDDYCLVEGLPLLNKEQGFTVLAKRKWISDINSKSQGFATKGTSAKWVDGAFYFESVEGNGSAPFNRVFDNSNGQRGVNYIRNFTENDITYLTSKEYNGSPLKNIGDAVDTDKLQLFKLTFDTTVNLSSIALYSFILFDRDLTEEEIEWVKENMIEGGGVMKYDWLSSPWHSYLSLGEAGRGTGTVTSYRFTIKAIRSDARVLETISILPSIESFKIQVLNLPEGVKMMYSGVLNNRHTNILTISRDGIYELPPINVESKFIGFKFDKLFENENVIIQQLLS